MTQPPKKKPAHSKGGYNSSNDEKNVPKNRNVPESPPLPPRDDIQIYVNPNNPADFIFLDYSPTPPKYHKYSYIFLHQMNYYFLFFFR